MSKIQTWFQNALGIKAPDNKKLIPFAPLDEGIFTTNDLTVEQQLTQYKSWVYAAVSKIAQECASVDIKLMQMEANGDVKEVDQHPVLDLLDSVNPFTTFSDLIEITKTYELLTGDAFWWLLKGTGGEVVEIWQYLRPDLVSVVPSKDTFISHYNYKVPGQGNIVRFEVDEIIQFKRINPNNPYRGVSPVKAGEWAIGTDNQASEYNWRFFGNNARPDFVFNFPDGIDSDEAKLFRTQWENTHQGTRNAGRVGIMSKGEIKNIGLSQKDMEFLNQRKFSRDEILTMFKVPKAILDPQEVNYASAQTAKNIFMEQTIIPEMIRFVNTLNEFLLPHYKDDRLFFDFESPINEDVEVTLKKYETLSRVGAISPNEIRQMEGLEPFDGGDEIKPTPEGNIGAPAKRFKGVIGKHKTRSTSAEMIEKIKKELKDSKALDKKKKIKLTDNGEVNKTDREKWADRYFKKQDDAIMKDEKEFASLLSAEFVRQKKNVLKSISSKNVSFTFNIKGEEGEFIDIFSAVQKALVLKYGANALEELGFGGFDTTEAVKNYLKSDALKFCTTVNETTKQRITNIISKGQEMGHSLPKISKEIEDTMNGWSDIKNPSARARAIAHTETAKSANFGSVEGWKQSGVVKGKEWYANPDACDICQPRHGKIVSIDKDFNFPNDITDSTFGDVSAPPAHVNCRCLTLPVVKSKAEFNLEMKRQQEELVKTISELKLKGDKTVDEIKKQSGEEIKSLKDTKDKLDKIIGDE